MLRSGSVSNTSCAVRQPTRRTARFSLHPYPFQSQIDLWSFPDGLIRTRAHERFGKDVQIRNGKPGVEGKSQTRRPGRHRRRTDGPNCKSRSIDRSSNAERGIIRSKHQRNNVGVAAAGLEAAGSQALTEVPAEFDKPVPLRICLRGQAQGFADVCGTIGR